MAAIDKLKTKSYIEFDALRLWAVVYYPKLLFRIDDPFFLREDWLAFCDEYGVIDEPIRIANFTCRQDRLLLWRCPLPFVREYLEKQCGLKTRWYHKLFWKGKNLSHAVELHL